MRSSFCVAIIINSILEGRYHINQIKRSQKSVQVFISLTTELEKEFLKTFKISQKSFKDRSYKWRPFRN